MPDITNPLSNYRENSPLLASVLRHRSSSNAQKKHSGLKIPRKGRIRLVLGIIAITLAIYIFKPPVKTTVSPALTAPVSVQTTAPLEKTMVPDRTPFSGFFKPWTFSRPKAPSTGTMYSFNDVTEMLRLSPPSLFSPFDTIRFKGRTVLAHYSIDTSLQALCHVLLKRYHPKYGAIAAVDPVNGRVLALVSYTNENEKVLGDDLFCRAPFPAASVFKTITAAGAIERGHLSCSSRVRQVGGRHTLYQSQLEKNPRSWSTDVAFEEAFAYSINPVFGRLGIFMLGKEGLNSYARRFGFQQKIPFELDNDAASIALTDSAFALAEIASGFNQQTRISPLLGALIASAIAEDGRMPRPFLVDSITNLSGTTRFYTAPHEPWLTPVKPRTALELKSMMGDVTQYGTARKAFRLAKQSRAFSGIEYGGKTGNINLDSVGRVDWFVGFARHPYDKTRRIAIGTVTIHGENWTIHSSRLTADIMRHFLSANSQNSTKTASVPAPAPDHASVNEQTAAVFKQEKSTPH